MSDYNPRSSPHLPKGEGVDAPKLLDRMQHYASAWDVDVADTLETPSSVIAFGMRDSRAVVLKVIKKPGDEWRSGEILKAFDGHGVARVYEWAPGAVLVERLQPGNSLVDLALNGRDEATTDILAGVIQQMSAPSSSISVRITAGVRDCARMGQRIRTLHRHRR